MHSQPYARACRKLERLVPVRAATITTFVLALLSNTAAQAFSYSDMFTTLNPGRLNLSIFGSGYGSDSYDRTHEGFEFDQSVTRFVGLVGRVSAYQTYNGDGFDSPFSSTETACLGNDDAPLIIKRNAKTTILPNPTVTKSCNFARFEGGIDLTPDLMPLFHRTSIQVLGGKDLGDSTTSLIDGGFSSWILFDSPHPINLSFNVTAYIQSNTRNFSRMDVRTVTYSTGKLALLVGAGGAIWGGGGEDLQGQAGPDVAVSLNSWRTTIDLQIGYGGAPHTYGLINVSKHFGWDE